MTYGEKKWLGGFILGMIAGGLITAIVTGNWFLSLI